MERRLTPGFPASDPLGSAQGETRGARVTCPGPCVAGPRTAAGGWLGCQHPEHCVRDTGSPGPLASAVAAGDAGGRGPQTHGPGPGVRDDGLECVVASDFRKGSDPFPRSGVRSPWLLVPKLPRAPRGPAALVVFASLPKRGPWDGGLREASARPAAASGSRASFFRRGSKAAGARPSTSVLLVLEPGTTFAAEACGVVRPVAGAPRAWGADASSRLHFASSNAPGWPGTFVLKPAGGGC